MGRKRHTAEEVVNKLRQADVELAKGTSIAAVAKLPSIRTPEKQSQLATGTCDHRAQTRPPVVPLSTREMGRSRATSRDFDEGGLNTAGASETACFAAQSDVAQRGAKVERRRLELPTPSLQS